MAKTAGQFAIEGSTLTGPAEYMRERGNALLDRVLAGQDQMFNMTAHFSPDVEMAVLVRLQTDFAGWLGMRRTIAELRRA